MELRKDKAMSSTIDTIKRLLAQVGIKTHITFQANPISFVYSCRVEIQGLPGVGTNGKGTTEIAALASAYSELMERLQNRILMEPLYTAFYNENGLERFPLWQELMKQTEDYLKDSVGVRKKLGDAVNFMSKGEQDIPFVNILTGEKIYLNDRILTHFLGSNGMCAGNTYEEALSQGFCEIMERHVLQNLYSRNITDKDISVIPRCCYRQYKIYDLIQEIEDMGYICRVLNCSLGGKFPVAGFLIVKPDSLRGKFALGCDYDLEIALQRCVTELFQGKNSMTALRYNMHSIFDMMWSDDADSFVDQTESYFAALRDWQGAIPQVLFTDFEDSDLAPFTKVSTNKEAYKLCVSCLGTQHQLLVRNVSFLGFPTYRIVVRGLSMVKTRASDYRQYCDSVMAARNIARRLQSGSELRMQDLMILTRLKDIPRYKYSSIYDLMGIVFRQDCPTITISEHLAQLYYLKGEYALSRQYVQSSQRKIDMFRSKIIYGKACGWDDTQIDRLFRVVGSDYRIETLIDAWIAEGMARFPYCPNCGSCGLRSDCAYEIFRDISHNLDSAYTKWMKEGEHV